MDEIKTRKTKMRLSYDNPILNYSGLTNVWWNHIASVTNKVIPILQERDKQ